MRSPSPLPRLLLSALVLLLLLFLYAGTAAACTCWYPQTLDDALADADRVFTATALSREEIPDSYQVAYVLQVHWIWQGPTAEHYTIVTEPDEAACGYVFEIGTEYLVFTSDRAGYDGYTWLCAGTGRVENSLAWIGELGAPPVVPAPASSWSAWKAAYGR